MFLKLLDLAVEHPGAAVYVVLVVSGTAFMFFLTRGHPSRW
jgi:hypothetical protein